MKSMKLNMNKHKFSRLLAAQDVVDYDAFREYAHQQLGCPYPTVAETKHVHKSLQKFFEDYPNAPYQSLTDIVRWAQVKERHTNLANLVDCYRYAYEDGYMKILLRGHTNDDKTLSALLAGVDDPEVRDRMTRAYSASERNAIHQAYLDTNTIPALEAGTSEPEAGTTSTQTYLDNFPLAVGQQIMYRTSPTDPFEYATVIGETDNKVCTYNGVERELSLPMIYVREEGEWIRCQK